MHDNKANTTYYCKCETHFTCTISKAHFTNHQVLNKKLTPINQQAIKMFNNTPVLLIGACLAPRGIL